MSDPQEAGDRCIIVVADLFAKINAQRKLLKRTPVEDRAIASRCSLRFNIDRPKKVDFNVEKIVLAPADIAVLEKIVNELFGIYFDGEIRRLCAKTNTQVVKRTRTILPSQVTAAAVVSQPEKTGLVTKIKRLFGGK